MKTPPRSNEAPFFLTARATSSSCSRPSTEHGPAITTIFSAQKRAFPTSTTEVSLWNSLLANCAFDEETMILSTRPVSLSSSVSAGGRFLCVTSSVFVPQTTGLVSICLLLRNSTAWATNWPLAGERTTTIKRSLFPTLVQAILALHDSLCCTCNVVRGESVNLHEFAQLSGLSKPVMDSDHFDWNRLVSARYFCNRTA